MLKFYCIFKKKFSLHWAQYTNGEKNTHFPLQFCKYKGSFVKLKGPFEIYLFC